MNSISQEICFQIKAIPITYMETKTKKNKDFVSEVYFGRKSKNLRNKISTFPHTSDLSNEILIYHCWDKDTVAQNSLLPDSERKKGTAVTLRWRKLWHLQQKITFCQLKEYPQNNSYRKISSAKARPKHKKLEPPNKQRKY